MKVLIKWKDIYYVTTRLMLYNLISNEIENDWLKKHDVIKTVIIKIVELKLSNATLVTGIENQLLCVVPRKTKSKRNKK